MATYVNNVRVEGPTSASETCHEFVARWLIAMGKLRGVRAESVNAHRAPDAFFPGGSGLPARKGGRIEVARNSIIGFFEGGILQHSMIAVSPTTWVGSRNHYTFQQGGNRVVFYNVDQMQGGGGNPGWVGTDNIWQSATQYSVWFRAVT